MIDQYVTFKMLDETCSLCNRQIKYGWDYYKIIRNNKITDTICSLCYRRRYNND